MKSTLNNLVIICVLSGICYLSACSGSSQKKAESINAGLDLFKTNCSACHQESGEGVSQLYPPLKGSDLLKKDPKRIACIIHNGLNGSLTVNGMEFNQVMPGLAGLSPHEVSDIANYVLNNFNQLNTYVDSTEVTKIWSTCK